MTSRQLKRLITHPAEMVRFQTTGKLPKGTKPDSPLLRLLWSLGQADLAHIRGLTIDLRLGYAGSRQFATAAQALRWLAPDGRNEVFGTYYAESWRDKQFQGPLHLEDLAACCSTFPSALFERHQGLRKPAGAPSRPRPTP